MNTIQVREIPDDAYETIRARAKAEGKSLQAYMRDQVIEMTRHPSKREAVATIEEALARFGPPAVTATTISADVQADRR